MGSGSQIATVAAVAIIVFYGIGGFLLGYLWTRFYLAHALRVAEELAYGGRSHE